MIQYALAAYGLESMRAAKVSTFGSDRSAPHRLDLRQFTQPRTTASLCTEKCRVRAPMWGVRWRSAQGRFKPYQNLLEKFAQVQSQQREQAGHCWEAHADQKLQMGQRPLRARSCGGKERPNAEAHLSQIHHRKLTCVPVHAHERDLGSRDRKQS
jgi:hypothetical protein